jgi:CRISPR-associated protein Cmr1
VKQTITAEFEIVTPMFLGGADQTEQLKQIRPPSVKGALRFWWRALQWNKVKDLQELHQKEARLFGAAANENDKKVKFGQSLFSLRVETKHWKDAPCPQSLLGLKYMLGQGLDGRRSLTGNFTVHVRFRPAAKEEDQQSVVEALMVWGLLGGLGARSRRGLGSVAVRKITGCDLSVPSSINELQSYLNNLAEKLNDNLPPFSAFSQESLIYSHGTDKQKPILLLDEVGKGMLLYRSYGRYDSRQKMHMVLGQEANQEFTTDHDAIHKAVKYGNCPVSLPKRSIFGLPHNYFFSSVSGGTADIQPIGEKRGRRASPLLVHIHKFPDGTLVAIQTVLKADFLPVNDRVEIKTYKLQKNNKLAYKKPDWDVLHTYLDQFGGERLI